MKQTNLIPTFIFFSGLLFTHVSCKKQELISSEQIKEFSVTSKYTTFDYDIKVVLPNGFNSDLSYETIYVLDGLSSYLNYRNVAEVSEILSGESGKQNSIVVGIGGAEHRMDDFTPSPTTGLTGGGGSENYTKFIEFELIPKIEAEFMVDTTAKSRIIIGHSLGGLYTGYLFTKHPKLFKNYLTLSPSIQWDDGILLDYEFETRESNSADSTFVYIGCGEFEEMIVVLAKEWYYRLSTYYPECRVAFKKWSNLAHTSSAMRNVEFGLELYYTNKKAE